MAVLDEFHPLVHAWFTERFAAPTGAQERAWAAIRRGEDTLVAAPTGSGKTLAAFLAGIDGLLRGTDHHASPGIDIVYVSPLKALSSDVHRNLDVPLADIAAMAHRRGEAIPHIRTALRTGDTPQAQRAAILRDVPNILVTTPESLYLMLTSERSRALLMRVGTVVVDELHALMRDKRGSHLMLSLERLDALCHVRPVRIGLSATVHPVAVAAGFLTGRDDEGRVRPCTVIDIGHRRDVDIAVQVPESDLEAVATNEQWGEIYDRIADLVGEHRTTLVFVNTRRMAERAAHQLEQRLGEGHVAAHHGSLSKDHRLRIEQRLKNGELRALVATASLELGIDVGSVDLVCQLGSPRAITTFLQRIGRAGHAVERTSKGRLFATTRDELVECAALIAAVHNGDLDDVEPAVAPLDILAQQIVAECACRDVGEDELFALVRRATPFAALRREDFDEVLVMLSEGPAPRLGRGRALLHRDRIGGALHARRAARLTAITGGGAIPEVGDYRVVLDPDDTFLGTVNEDWAIESQAGDIFLLGSHAWRIRRVESARGTLRVDDAGGQSPTVPFWLGEAPGRTWVLSQATSRLRRHVGDLDDAGAAVDWLRTTAGLDDAAAAQIVEYVRAEKAAIGIIPATGDVVFERFFDDSGGMQIVVHAPFGARVNRGFGLALRKRFCVTFDFELQAAATDDAVVLSLGPQHSFPLEDAFTFVRSGNVVETLRQAVLAVPMFTTRWRQNATRSLMLPRHSGGRQVPFPIQRMRADDLLAAVFPAQVACQENNAGPVQIPDHPLVDQTLHDCLHEAIDIDRLTEVLRAMEQGEIRLHARDVTEPSPFAHEILNANPYAFLDDAPLEERRTQAVNLRRVLPENQRDLGTLDADAIERVSDAAQPVARDAHELHDVLTTLVLNRPVAAWRDLFDELVSSGRACSMQTGDGEFWCAAEEVPAVEALHPGAEQRPRIRLPESLATARDADVVLETAVRGHMESAGPVTAAALAERIGVREVSVRTALARLQGEGLVMTGRFTPGAQTDEYCDRRLLARIHRATLDHLRSQIEPVTAQDLMRYLIARHGLTPASRREGKRGVVEVIAMLQGFEIPAIVWENEILAPRVQGYRSSWLDELCLEGEVAWARLSVSESATSSRRLTATRATPVSLVLRRDLPWLMQAARRDVAPADPATGAAAAVLNALRTEGALFLDDIAHVTRRLPTEVEEALWELVSRGLVHGDGFGALRQIMRRRHVRRSDTTRPRAALAAGRWSVLRSLHVELNDEELAERVARQLLTRYGVVFRDLIPREQGLPPWRLVVRALRRMESRGTVRGGRFVSGFIGEQYGLTEAVDGLRAVRRAPRGDAVVEINATDPLNLVGIVLPGGRAQAIHTHHVTLRDGVVALA